MVLNGNLKTCGFRWKENCRMWGFRCSSLHQNEEPFCLGCTFQKIVMEMFLVRNNGSVLIASNSLLSLGCQFLNLRKENNYVRRSIKNKNAHRKERA